MTQRNQSIDYLKSIFIILMVIFHLVYIGDKYPYAKQIVYTFHIPAFLIISGYLANVQKGSKQFLYSVLWLFVSYSIMEVGYVFMSSVLPVRESVGQLSFSSVLNKIFLSPMGPYWYLHTLILCYLTYYVVHKISQRMNAISFLLLLGICFWILTEYFQLLSMANVIYFMIGIIIFRSKQAFSAIFQPSILCLFPLIILCCYPENLDRFTLAGIVITYLAISFLLWLYIYMPQKCKRLMHYIGRNTLVILLFSPIFTMAAKVMLPLFSFDNSGMAFLFTALSLVILGSFAIAWCMDRVGLSRWFCGKPRMLTNYEASVDKKESMAVTNEV